MAVIADNTTSTARRLAQLIEPVVGQVYFSPECHQAYAKLGFAASSGFAGKAALPDGPAYFTSRGSVMGQVPGEVVSATFAVFSPTAVIPAVTYGWTLTDAATICAARDDGAIAQLRRVLGDKPAGLVRVTELLMAMADTLRPEGRGLFAGVRSLGYPDDSIGRMWRAGDLLREYRGDSHTASWVAAGLDATEICLLTDLWYGLPMRSYSRTRAWTDAEFDRAEEQLRFRGLLAGDGMSERGRAMREHIEDDTDEQMSAAIEELGSDADELFALLEPWGVTLREAGAYLSAGPSDLATRR